MSDVHILPRAAVPFVGFPSVLRAHAFAVAPDQTIGFLEAIELLGPRNIEDIRRAGIAMMSIPKDREEEYDALFRAFFLGMTAPGVTEAEDESVAAHEASGMEEEIEEIDPDAEPGEEATLQERLSYRALEADDPETALAHFRRLATQRLPRRRSYRFASDQRGKQLDLRRTLRDAAKRDGEVFTLSRRRRKDRQRKIALLIDVSGSMKDRTEAALTFAHALISVGDRIEVFTLGTRLTRVTPALRLRNMEQALERVSGLISDVDGGTRLGEALSAFLSVPRYAGFARGASVVVLSDGLERGTPEVMIEAVRRLSRMAWRLDWLTPLAADAEFAPSTSGLNAVLPDLDSLANGATTTAIAHHLLNLETRARVRGLA